MISRSIVIDGIPVYLNIEEEIIIDKIELVDDIISSSDLSLYERALCKSMVMKGLLNKIKEDNKIYFMINDGGN